MPAIALSETELFWTLHPARDVEAATWSALVSMGVRGAAGGSLGLFMLEGFFSCIFCLLFNFFVPVFSFFPDDVFHVVVFFNYYYYFVLYFLFNVELFCVPIFVFYIFLGDIFSSFFFLLLFFLSFSSSFVF